MQNIGILVIFLSIFLPPGCVYWAARARARAPWPSMQICWALLAVGRTGRRLRPWRFWPSKNRDFPSMFFMENSGIVWENYEIHSLWISIFWFFGVKQWIFHRLWLWISIFFGLNNRTSLSKVFWNCKPWKHGFDMICTMTKNQLTKLTNGFLTLWLSWGLFHVVSSGIGHQSRGLSKIEWIVFDKHMGVIYI